MKFQGKKYKLLCYSSQKLLLLKDFIPYAYKNSEKDGKALNTLEI